MIQKTQKGFTLHLFRRGAVAIGLQKPLGDYVSKQARTTRSPKTGAGFIAVITVLVVLVFSLSVVIGTTYLSIGSAQSARVFSEGEETLQLAEGCAEDALLLGTRDENYAGGNYEYLGGTCDVNISKDGTTWTFGVTGTKNTLKRSVEIIASRQATLPVIFVLGSWREQ